MQQANLTLYIDYRGITSLQQLEENPAEYTYLANNWNILISANAEQDCLLLTINWVLFDQLHEYIEPLDKKSDLVDGA